MSDNIILVDERDREIGKGAKLAVHQAGQLHRAFSILVFNGKGELLLQQRAKNKYHSGGLWANTCCSHPRVGESLDIATHRRLQEEMGFDCEIKETFSFIYKVKLDKGLTEHEYDHVFVSYYDGEIRPNPDEVADYKWLSVENIKKDINLNPDIYAPWFKIIIKEFEPAAERGSRLKSLGRGQGL